MPRLFTALELPERIAAQMALARGGVVGAIDLQPIPGSPGERVYRALDHLFFDSGVMLRPAGDTIELNPPLIVSEDQISEIMEKVGSAVKAAA
jgi:beta-alanine--pyruvate transaminase